MSKSGVYINGKKVCDVTDNSDVQLIPKSVSIQGGSASVVNSSNSRIVNSFNNQGVINQGANSGDIHFVDSKIVVNGQEFLIDEHTNQQDVKIEIYGDVKSVYTKNGSLKVSADNIESVESKNGSITVNAKSVGSVKTKNGSIKTNN